MACGPVDACSCFCEAYVLCQEGFNARTQLGTSLTVVPLPDSTGSSPFVRLVENPAKPFLSKNWGKAPCAFMGVWGRCEPPQSAKAASRGTKCHGVRDARPLQDLPVAMLLDSAGSSPIAEFAENTLAVLRRSRPFSYEAPFLTVLLPKATLGVALPPRGLYLCYNLVEERIAAPCLLLGN